jgi:hypothetical protein
MGGGAASDVASWWARPTVLAATLTAPCGALLAASYLHSDWTTNDFERFNDLRLTGLFFALFLGWCGAYVALYAQRCTASRRLLWAGTLAAVTLLFASFPVGSKDVFAYSFLGRMWGFHHVNPYAVVPGAFADDAWSRFLSGQPFSVYGPPFLWQTWLVNALAADSLWRAVALHKALSTAALLASVVLADWVLRCNQTGGRWMLLFAWNPLLLFESAGSAHNDAVMVALVLAMIGCCATHRLGAAATLLVLSVWYKWYSLIFLPPLLITTLQIAGPRALLRQVVVFLVVGAMLGGLFLLPLPGSMGAIIGEWLRPQKMRGIYPAELSPVLAGLFWSFRAVGLFERGVGFQLFDVIRFGLFGLATVAVLIRQWRAASPLSALIDSCCLLGIAAFALLITQLWPWHLETVIALGLVSGREPYAGLAVLVTVLGLLSYFLTFGVATVGVIAIAGSLWVLRRLRAQSG